MGGYWRLEWVNWIEGVKLKGEGGGLGGVGGETELGG